MNKNASKLLAAALATSAIVVPVSASAATAVEEGIYFSATGQFYTTTQLEALSIQQIGELFSKNTPAQVYIYLKGVGTASLAQANSSDFITAANANGHKDAPQNIIPGGTYVGKDGASVEIGKPAATELKVESVSAINAKQIQVKFSTPVTKASAEGAAVSVTKVVGNTNMNPGSKALSADGKTLTINLGTEMVNSKAGYAFSVAKDVIQTTDGKKLAATEVIFDGVATADTAAPEVVTANYDATNNQVTLTFSKDINRVDANINEAKITIKGAGENQSVTLDETALTEDATPGNTVTLKVPASVASFKTPLTLELAAGAVKDTNSPAVENVAKTYELQLNAAPQVTSASYDETNDRLTINLSETVSVKTSDIVLANIKLVINGAETALDAAAKIETTTNGAKVVITDALGTSRSNATTSLAQLKLVAGAFKDLTNTTSPKQDAVALTYTDDVTPATVNAAAFNNLSNVVTVDFSEVVNTSAIVTGVFKINDVALTFGTNATLLTNAKSNKMLIQLSGTAATEAAKKDAKFTAIKDKLVDPTGNKNKADASVTISTTDAVRPTFTLAEPTLNNKVVVVFSEEVNADTAKLAANYKITSSTDSTKELAVKGVEVLPFDKAAGTQTVILTTDEAEAITYLLSVSNVKDLAGNTLSGAKTPASSPVLGNASTDDQYFTGKAGVADIIGPSIATAKLVDTDGNTAVNKGDQIVVVFNEQIKATEFKATDFNLGTKVLGTTTDAPKFALANDGRTLTITLGDVSANTPVVDSTVTGSGIDLSATTTIVDLAGNKGVADGSADVAIANPLKDTDLLISSIIYADTDKSGAVDTADKVVITFNRDITVTGTPTLASIFSAGYTNLGATNGSATVSAVSGKNNQVEFTLTAPAGITTNSVLKAQQTAATTISALVGPSNVIKDKWGNEIALSKTAPVIKSEDTTAPAIISAVVTKNGSTPDILEATDTIKLTFTEEVSEAQAKALLSTIYAKNGELTSVFNGTATEVAKGSTAKEIVLTLPASASWTGFTIEGTKLSTTSGSKVFSDASGNAAVVSGLQLTKVTP